MSVQADALQAMDYLRFVEVTSSKVTVEQAQSVVGMEGELRRVLARAMPLARLVDDLLTLMSLVRDWAMGHYREVPWNTIAAATFAILYVLSPMDLLPDLVPVLGFLDDAGVVTACLALVGRDVEVYRLRMRARAS
jgi:uncharacterized membrane protein YkvA (DUF1232 family)